MSILVATPCYGNRTTLYCEQSCYNLKKEFLAAGVAHDFLKIGNESLVTRARDVIASSFLNETKFECLLFVDADIEFQPADAALLWNLCVEGADVAAGEYRHKNLLAKHAAWVNGGLRPIEDFKEPFQVDYAGTGFMMIRRQTFARLIELHPDWEYQEGFPLDEKPGEMTCWGFFQDPIADCENGRFKLSEDYFFCSEVRKAGMKVMMHPDIHLKHWGDFPF